MYNVVCVKFGTKYSADFVNKLYNDIARLTQSDFKFFCYTDDPEGIIPEVNIIPPLGRPTLKGVWNKLRLFDPAMPFKGKTFFFDLDVKIVKDPLVREDPEDWRRLSLVSSHWKTGKLYNRLSNYDVKINSSVMTWDASNEDMHEYWNHFNSGFRDYFMRKYVGIDRYIVHEDFSYFVFEKQYIQSKKYQAEVDYEPCVVTFEEIDVGIDDLK